jgi:hypothetical protein
MVHRGSLNPHLADLMGNDLDTPAGMVQGSTWHQDTIDPQHGEVSTGAALQ